jgi:hypothetical protein
MLIVGISSLPGEETSIFSTLDPCAHQLWSELFHLMAPYQSDAPNS